jgi:DNA-binding transcriptional MerR regulator
MEIFKTFNDTISEILRLLEEIKELASRPKEDPSNIWLDNQEAMEFLKISSRTLVTYRQKGILKYSQTGSKIYYRKSDILETLENHHRAVEAS